MSNASSRLTADFHLLRLRKRLFGSLTFSEIVDDPDKDWFLVLLSMTG